MRADRNDLPEYLRVRKKPSPWRFVTILGVGSVIFWGLVTLFAKPIVIDIDQIKRGIHIAGTPWFNQKQEDPTQAAHPYQAQLEASEQAKTTGQRALTKDEIEWFEQTSREAQARKETRQTSFNDQNYQPRGAINTIAPPPARYYASNEPRRSNQSTRTMKRYEKSDLWEWQDAYNKRTTRKRFEWIEVNGQIDWNSVCQNYKRGSLIYRDCRKGAKVAFKRICNQNQAACAAENNFMP